LLLGKDGRYPSSMDSALPWPILWKAHGSMILNSKDSFPEALQIFKDPSLSKAMYSL